jgi:hypothetical protein
MEATELRIGNLVYENEHKHQIDIDDLHLADIFTAIPITEEWLFKFGFEKQDKYWFFLRTHYANFDEFNYSILFEKVTLEKNSIELGICNTIKYIHQLQNLYFALTNTELQIQ